MNIEIIKTKRKTISLEIQREGRVIVRAPLGITERELEDFIESHKSWIERKRRLLEERKQQALSIKAPPSDEISPQEWKQIKTSFAEAVEEYCHRMNVTVGRITIRDQKTRWGSCSAKGNVNFNYRLYYMPRELMEYVVVHELAHRKHMDHSARFWEEVARYCPKYRIHRKELKKYEI